MGLITLLIKFAILIFPTLFRFQWHIFFFSFNMWIIIRTVLAVQNWKFQVSKKKI